MNTSIRRLAGIAGVLALTAIACGEDPDGADAPNTTLDSGAPGNTGSPPDTDAGTGPDDAGFIVSRCSTITAETVGLEQTTFQVTQLVTDGVLTLADGTIAQQDLPPFCRIAGTIEPAVAFEVLMPTEAWNGRLMAVGNGGMTGSIGYAALGTWLRLGYVSVATDTGHTVQNGFDASWALDRRDYLTFDFDQDVESAIEAVGGALDASDPDLSAFRARGGKLLHYHGLADPDISPQSSIDYYEAVLVELGNPVGDFYRLFLPPGMGHCAGGPGPLIDGFDAQQKLEVWVEQGTPPNTLDSFGSDGATRPLCPYPERAVWDGTGDVTQMASFDCVAPSP